MLELILPALPEEMFHKIPKQKLVLEKNSKNQKKKGASNSAAAEVSNNRGFVD